MNRKQISIKEVEELEEDEYDEFGNLILERRKESGRDTSLVSTVIRQEEEDEDEQVEEEDTPSQLIVLNEDKKYYSDAAVVYGDDVELKVEEEDTQSLSEGILKKNKKSNIGVISSTTSSSYTSKMDDYFKFLFLQKQQQHETVLVVGSTLSGKTAIMERLLLDSSCKKEKKMRRISKGDFVYSVVKEDSKGKLHYLQFIDTPGQSSFQPEVLNTLCCFGNGGGVISVVVVVDVVTGVDLYTSRLLKALSSSSSCSTNNRVVIILNKMDRLVTELRLPPQDAFFKINSVLEELSQLVKGGVNVYENVVFSAAAAASSGIGGSDGDGKELNCWFTLESIAEEYCSHSSTSDLTMLSKYELKKRLYGINTFYNEDTGKFSSSNVGAGGDGAGAGAGKLSFVHFVLEPFYKFIVACISGKQTRNYGKVFCKDSVMIDVLLQKQQQQKQQLQHQEKEEQFRFSVLKSVDVKISPTEKEGGGGGGQRMLLLMSRLNGCSGFKFYNTKRQVVEGGEDQQQQQKKKKKELMNALNRVKVVQPTSANGEEDDDDEEFSLEMVMDVYIVYGKEFVSLGELYKEEEVVTVPGNTLCFIDIGGSFANGSGGVGNNDKDASYNSCYKGCYIVSVENEERLKPLLIQPSQSYFKVSIEPLQPQDLPRMIQVLRKVLAMYTCLELKIEESGEYCLLGTGELYFDAVLQSIRGLHYYNSSQFLVDSGSSSWNEKGFDAETGVAVRVSDPYVAFRETIVDSTADMPSFAKSPNQENLLQIVSEPLESAVVKDLENGNIQKQRLQDVMVANREKYGWDLLACRGILGFSEENCIVDDTLSDEVDKKVLSTVKESIVQGFQWAVKEGPLCDEPMRQVKVRLTHAQLAKEPFKRAPGQIVPTARRVVYSSFLMSTPRLMEPVNIVEILTPKQCFDVISMIIQRRRGNITMDTPHPGTPLYVVRALVPLIETFGMETDLRVATQGQAQVQQLFDHWALVPGDPLDTSAVLKTMEPAPVQFLARDFVLKTRRRKGLGDEVNVVKYFDEAMLEALRGDDFEQGK